MNHDGRVGLEEAVSALQSLSRHTPFDLAAFGVKIIHEIDRYLNITAFCSGLLKSNILTNWNAPFWNLSTWILFALGCMMIVWHRLYLVRETVIEPNQSVFFNSQRQYYAVLIIGFLLIVLLRGWDIHKVMSGQWTSDEIYSSVLYLADMFEGRRPYRVETTHIISHCIGLHVIYSLLGFSVTSARSLSAIVGIISLIPFFLFHRRVWGRDVACVSTLIYGTLLYAVYFSKMGYEPFWGLTLFCFVPFLFQYIRNKDSSVARISCAMILVFGFFTYPSFWIQFISLIIIGGIVLLIFRPLRDMNTLGHQILRCIPGILLFGCIFLSVIYFYKTMFNSALLSIGGGSFHIKFKALLDAASVVFREIIFKTESWYLPYDMPFFERGLWIFAIVGIVVTWRGAPTLWGKALTLLFLLLCLSVIPSGAYPGMRRAPGTLFAFSTLSGIGFVAIYTYLRMQSKTKTSAVFIILLLLGITHTIFFQVTAGARRLHSNFGTGLSYEAFPDVLIKKYADSHMLIFDENDYKTDFDKNYIRAQIEHIKRYNSMNPEPYKFCFVKLTNLRHATITDSVLLTRNPLTIAQWQLAWSQCFNTQRLPEISESGVYIIELKKHGEADVTCMNAAKRRGLIQSDLKLGWNHYRRLAIHEFESKGIQLNPHNPEVIYVNNGYIRFLLKVPDNFGRVHFCACEC